MADPSGKRSSGAVKWFSPHRGFGFIAPDDGGDDLFVHQTAIRSEGFRTLSEGQPVEFGVDIGDDGRPKAVDVAALGRSQRGGGRGRGSYDIRARGGFRGGTRGRGGYGGYTGSGGVCYNCGRMGHLARECYQSSGTSGGGGGGYGRRRYGGGGGGGDGDGGYGRRRYGGGGGGAEGGGGGSRGGGACYSCGEEGHFARDCYNYDQK